MYNLIFQVQHIFVKNGSVDTSNVPNIFTSNNNPTGEGIINKNHYEGVL